MRYLQVVIVTNLKQLSTLVPRLHSETVYRTVSSGGGLGARLTIA